MGQKYTLFQHAVQIKSFFAQIAVTAGILSRSHLSSSNFNAVHYRINVTEPFAVRSFSPRGL